MRLIEFMFIRHFGQAWIAALLSMGGVLLSYPVIKWDIKGLQAVPLWIFRTVLKLLGDQPGLVRMSMVIFCFNSAAMFLYMATGVHALIPELIAACTGFNIAVILFKTRERNEFSELGVPGSAHWHPGRSLTRLCGLMVIVLELPCFWYSIAMGMSLGSEIHAHQITYVQGMAVRGQAYGTFFVPMLFLSALCESLAVRGMWDRTDYVHSPGIQT
jgi:hypothetical protein